MIDKEKMRGVGSLASEILEEIGKIIKPGISTKDIDDYGVRLIRERGARASCFGYRGFPKSLCTSVNDVICHGVPSEKVILNSGDFINVDLVIELDGHYGDTSQCFFVGKVNEKIKDLVNTTYEAMWAAIEICKEGEKLNKIGFTIENIIKKKGYSVVRDFCGHGIGNSMHMTPDVLHYFDPKSTTILKEGMCITIEPMINGGKNYKCRILKDGWTAKTVDGSMSAQWEHTIYINKDGCEVMTFNSYDEKNGKKRINKILN